MQVVIHHNLGGMYFDEGELVQARFHYGEASRLSTEILGGRHPLGAHPLAGLGDVDAREGKPDAAMRNYQAALTVMEVSYGPEHIYLLHPLTGLGRVHELAGRSDEARRHYARAVRIGDLHEANIPLLADSLMGLASLAAAAGDPSGARALSERARHIYESSASPFATPSQTGATPVAMADLGG